MGANVEWTDGDLARTVTAGEPASAEAAESELYRRFAPRVRLYGLRHLRNEEAARDLAQQVLLVTIEKLRDGSVRDADQIASFILGMSRTMARDLKRQEWRREKLRDVFITPSAFTVHAEEPVLDLDRLETCLARLAERDRLVVLLTFYAEKTATDVGRELNVSEGNVRVIRHRAVQRLRACVMSGEAVA
jgi:RNA polymerase sigma-70 factor (ECF subfamily)